jgi:hypothetical protein
MNIMHKFAVIGLVALAGLTFTGCSVPTAPGDTDGYSVETVTVGGEQFDCTFHNKGWDTGAMSCEPLAGDAGRGKNDTDGFSREIVIAGGKKLDCLFYHKGWDSGAMSCQPVKA